MGKVAEKIILGIDPGTVVMGYGVIEVHGQKIKLLSLGVVHLSKYPDHAQKLRTIFEKISFLITQYSPDECAIEAPFYGKNVQSMLKLGRAQGVCMAAALSRDIPVVEYAPKKIKQSITGNGNASKEQVAGMLNQLCKFQATPKFLDATDGLAAAVCHHFQSNALSSSGKKFSSWKDFAVNNPKRVKR